ncbi:MAG: metallophosphoesterase [Anaerolineae bacterium]|nr:metallophosphoesterase [Anaerolineae bacterium]
MRIGVISDIHDNIWALREALQRLQGCEVLLCLGDLCAPFTITEIAQGFAGKVYLVWGNNDGDKLLIGQNAAKAGNVEILGGFGELELEGRSIALTHYPHLGRALAKGQQYDLVCYGHNHQRAQEWVGRTLLLNPGEVMGRLGVRSIAIYDTEKGEAEIIEF